MVAFAAALGQTDSLSRKYEAIGKTHDVAGTGVYLFKKQDPVPKFEEWKKRRCTKEEAAGSEPSPTLVLGPLTMY